MILAIRAFGRPAPQGSKERGAAGQLLESSVHLPAWRREVKVAAYEAYHKAGIVPERLPLFPRRVPVIIERMHFYVTPVQCLAVDTDEPIGKPDLDKFMRGVLDALGGRTDPRNTARLYADDSQVKRCFDLGKFRATPEHAPGAIIIVSDRRV